MKETYFVCSKTRFSFTSSFKNTFWRIDIHVKFLFYNLLFIKYLSEYLSILFIKYLSEENVTLSQ